MKAIKLRANNDVYLAQAKQYFESLVPVLRTFLATKRGPIVLLQIQNEYGFYGTDKTQIARIPQLWKQLKMDCEYYYIDSWQNIQKSHWPGAHVGVNGKLDSRIQAHVRSIEKNGRVFGGEIYSRQITHWGERLGGKSLPKLVEQLFSNFSLKGATFQSSFFKTLAYFYNFEN